MGYRGGLDAVEKRKSRASAVNWTHISDCPAHSLATVMSGLSRPNFLLCSFSPPSPYSLKIVSTFIIVQLSKSYNVVFEILPLHDIFNETK